MHLLRHRLPRLGAAFFLFLTVSAYAGWLHADQATAPQAAQIAEHLSPYGLQGAVISPGRSCLQGERDLL